MTEIVCSLTEIKKKKTTDENSYNILKNKNKKGELHYQIEICDETILKIM